MNSVSLMMLTTLTQSDNIEAYNKGTHCHLIYLWFLSAADLLRTVRGATFSFYADDLVIYSPNLAPIQEAISVLANWCTENRMEVNVNKTEVHKI